jgi:hypothetical protein
LLSGIIAPEIEIVFVAALVEVIIFESPSEPGACSVPTPFSERLSGKARYPCRLPDFCFSTYETDTCSAVDRLDTSVESIDMNGEGSRLGSYHHHAALLRSAFASHGFAVKYLTEIDSLVAETDAPVGQARINPPW